MPTLSNDWQPRDERDARIEELEAEVERLLAQALSMTVYAWGQEARIEAALAIPGKVREEMAHPLWPSLTEDDLLTKVEELLVKALKGGFDAE